MAGRMVPVGRLQVATPASMALSIRSATEATQAVDERVLEVATGYFSQMDEVTAAAAQRALTDAGLTRTVTTVEDDSDDAVYKFLLGGAAGLNAEGHFSRRTTERVAAHAFMAPRSAIVRDAAGRIVSETIGGVPVRNVLRDAAGRVFQYSIGDRTISVTRDAAGRLTGEQ